MAANSVRPSGEKRSGVDEPDRTAEAQPGEHAMGAGVQDDRLAAADGEP